AVGFAMQRARRDRRADGGDAAAERLGEDANVGHDLGRVQLPRAADAGLHFVEDEKRAMPAAQRLRLLQVSVGRYADAALALDRLDDECGDIARQHLLQRIQIAERNLGVVRARYERRALALVAHDAQRAERRAVIAA